MIRTLVPVEGLRTFVAPGLSEYVVNDALGTLNVWTALATHVRATMEISAIAKCVVVRTKPSRIIVCWTFLDYCAPMAATRIK
jgi:hypothetical protein